MDRKEQLERSIIYTPRNPAEIQDAIEKLEYSRKIGDSQFIPLYMRMIEQGREYAEIIAQEKES